MTSFWGLDFSDGLVLADVEALEFGGLEFGRLPPPPPPAEAAVTRPALVERLLDTFRVKVFVRVASPSRGPPCLAKLGETTILGVANAGNIGLFFSRGDHTLNVSVFSGIDSASVPKRSTFGPPEGVLLRASAVDTAPGGTGV